MGKKYIYGKRTTDTPFLVNENEFHFLCKYLGAYLKYEREKSLHENFEDYLRKYNVKEIILTKPCWGYINEAQKHIRDNLNEIEERKSISPFQNSRKHTFSKREIRKLGYYSTLSTPGIPKYACEIETELFNTIFNNEKFKEVSICFNDYLFETWEKNDNRSNYFTIDNPNAINVTKTYFIGFQKNVIEYNLPKYKDLFMRFKENFGYKYIQSGLDERHS